MFFNWEEVQRTLVPIKDYVDLIGRFHHSFAYPFVCETFNLSMPELADYTRRLLGGDARGRYTEYAARLEGVFQELDQAGVQNILDWIARVETPERLEVFSEQNRIYAHDVVAGLKYLVYWFVPAEKYLSGLIRAELEPGNAIQALRSAGIRTNLEILQRGISAVGRKSLAASSGLPETVILELVNRADFSRLPWASKATISNIIGAGYSSLAELANANPDQLYADFFGYGKAIGKNLKLGNEIENSYRIAKIVPALLREN